MNFLPCWTDSRWVLWSLPPDSHTEWLHFLYFTTGSPGKKLTRHHQQSGKSQIFHNLGKVKWRLHVSYHVPEAFLLTSTLAEQCMHHQEGPWVRMISQRQSGNQFHQHKTLDCESRGRVVLPGSLTILASAWAFLPNKVSCFVSKCVSLDNSFLSLRRESPFELWKGFPFLQLSCFFLLTWPQKPKAIKSAKQELSKEENFDQDQRTKINGWRKCHGNSWPRENNQPYVTIMVWSVMSLFHPMDCSTSGVPVLHCFPEFTQTHDNWVMPSNHLILCHPCSPALNLSQHQGLFQWVGSSHQAEY